MHLYLQLSFVGDSTFHFFEMRCAESNQNRDSIEGGPMRAYYYMSSLCQTPGIYIHFCNQLLTS